MGGINLSRRALLKSALLGAGAVAVGGAGVAVASAVGRRLFGSEDAAIAEAWRLIEEEGASRVIVRGGEIAAVAKGRGVRPILALLETDGAALAGAIVVDSVVGLPAAAVAVKGRAAKVLARTASEPARDFLTRSGVPLEAKVVVPNILNRDLTGVCPLEASLVALNGAGPDALVAQAYATLDGLRHRPVA